MAALIRVPFVHTPAPASAPPKRRIIAAPRLWWKGAVKQVAKPCHVPPRWMRKRKSGGQGNTSLPWHLPRPMTADERIWADYRAFKAAGLLGTWFEMYRDVLNLEPLPEPAPS